MRKTLLIASLTFIGGYLIGNTKRKHSIKSKSMIYKRKMIGFGKTTKKVSMKIKNSMRKRKNSGRKKKISGTKISY